MKTLLLAVVLNALALQAPADPPAAPGQGYDGEWAYVSRHLVALAEAVPAEKFAWRPGPGVRSTSEVLMHIVIANFRLLSAAGSPLPPELRSVNLEKTVTAKADVISWLKRALDAVKTSRADLKPSDLQCGIKVLGRDSTVDAMYLRIMVHANEHLGQLVAYARINAIVPPWSQPARK